MEQGGVVGDLQIAGFWRRVAAFAIDVIVLGLVGEVLGMLLFNPLARAGGLALIPGFIIAVIYFGAGNSREARGQTPGKRLLGIRVVDRNGALLELPSSMLRYAVLGGPYFLACIPRPMGFDLLSFLLVTLAGFGQLATLYLFVFNRRTRQSLHDLVVGTYVVRVADEPQAARFATFWRGHWVVVGIIGALALVAPFTTNLFMGSRLKPLLSAAGDLMSQPHVRGVQVTQNTMSFNGQAPTHSLIATIELNAPLVEDAGLARQLADVIGDSEVDLSGEDRVVVSLNYGFNMGIARGNKIHGYAYRPDELGHAEPEGAGPASTQ